MSAAEIVPAQSSPRASLPGWDCEVGGHWWVYVKSSHSGTYRHEYAKAIGEVWRWNPGDAGTGPWVIEALRPLDGSPCLARASVGGVREYRDRDLALHACMRVRRDWLNSAAHDEMQSASRVFTRASSLWVAQRRVVTETQDIALREGIEWPLHCALACDVMRGLT